MAGISFTHTRLSLVLIDHRPRIAWGQPPTDCKPSSLNIPARRIRVFTLTTA